MGVQINRKKIFTARGVLILKGTLLYWAFSSSGKEALNTLKTTYDDVSGDCPPHRWSSPNPAMPRIYNFTRSIVWLKVFLCERLTRTWS